MGLDLLKLMRDEIKRTGRGFLVLFCFSQSNLRYLGFGFMFEMLLRI